MSQDECRSSEDFDEENYMSIPSNGTINELSQINFHKTFKVAVPERISLRQLYIWLVFGFTPLPRNIELQLAHLPVLDPRLFQSYTRVEIAKSVKEKTQALLENGLLHAVGLVNEQTIAIPVEYWKLPLLSIKWPASSADIEMFSYRLGLESGTEKQKRAATLIEKFEKTHNTTSYSKITFALSDIVRLFDGTKITYKSYSAKHSLEDTTYVMKLAEQLKEREFSASNHIGFEELLHPIINGSSYQLYCDGHLREAVLNSITAVCDLIRNKTGSHEDGDALIGKVFSIEHPLLVLSELDSISGQNDQKGFMQIFKGSYQGIRNPKAHSLTHDLTPLKAAQYLVFVSLLARRVDEAKLISKNDAVPTMGKKAG